MDLGVDCRICTY